jgi:hypothetical protein
MINNNLISDETNLSDPISKINETKEVLIFHQLHSAQQEINNLRLLNVCLQSTLLRVQSQLIDYLPVNIPDEIKRNETKQKLALLRPTDDHTRRIIQPQQISFIENLKILFDKKQEAPIKSIPLSKNEKQIDILFEMFHELNTIIHTEHHDRICQLYITLAQTSHSVIKAREGRE